MSNSVATAPRTSEAARQARPIPVRRVSFQTSLAELPKHFCEDGDLVSSHVVACLSSVFPDGEDFFVRSVRAFRHQLDDPTLESEVKGFIGQEAVHGREHRAFNDRLAELGYSTKRMERTTERILGWRTKNLDPRWNLAATAALEHFTATLAYVILSTPEGREMFGDGPVGDVLLWHALEECEHKAVAFDVYRAAGGSERVRTAQMNIVTVGFLTTMAVEVTVSVLRDPASRERGRLRQSLARFRKSPIMQRDVWRRLRDYNRPDFHPDDHDMTDLTEHWREELFGAEGKLNELLVGPK